MTKVTIKDIANKLGVSAQAVSRALNNKPNISNDLKKRVLEKADEMGYIKNSVAASLKTNKSKIIGLFNFRRSIEIRQRVINGIISEARQHDYDVLMFTMNSELDSSVSYAKLCRQRMVDGVIFTGLRLDDPHLEEIKQLDIPVVVFDTDLGRDCNNISMDHREAVKVMVRNLKDDGHENIAILLGHDAAEITHEVARYYKKEVDTKYHNIIHTEFNRESAYEHSGGLFKSNPTAVIAINNSVSIGFLDYCNDNGIKVPEDVSLIQMNDITLSKYMSPPLTSIYQNDFLRGKLAVELVVKGKKGMSIKVDPELKVRKSVKKIN